MAFDVVLRRLLACKNGFHRTLKQERCQSGLALDGELFLSSEGAAGGSQLDFHFFERQFQNVSDLFLVVSAALTLRENSYAIPGRQSQTRLRFEECRFDRLSDKCLLDDVGRRGKRSLHISA